jgi:hypothetical protein
VHAATPPRTFQQNHSYTVERMTYLILLDETVPDSTTPCRRIGLLSMRERQYHSKEMSPSTTAALSKTLWATDRYEKKEVLDLILESIPVVILLLIRKPCPFSCDLLLLCLALLWISRRQRKR